MLYEHLSTEGFHDNTLFPQKILMAMSSKAARDFILNCWSPRGNLTNHYPAKSFIGGTGRMFSTVLRLQQQTHYDLHMHYRMFTDGDWWTAAVKVHSYDPDGSRFSSSCITGSPQTHFSNLELSPLSVITSTLSHCGNGQRMDHSPWDPLSPFFLVLQT